MSDFYLSFWLRIYEPGDGRRSVSSAINFIHWALMYTLLTDSGPLGDVKVAAH